MSRESTALEIGATTYRRITGSLRYLIHMRPDLAFLVGYVSRFMERHTVQHMDAVKRLLRCIAGTIDYGLVSPTHMVHRRQNWLVIRTVTTPAMST